MEKIDHQFKQPELTDEWGCPFYGKAETITGDFWWYTDSDRKRHPLCAAHPIAGDPNEEWELRPKN